MWYGPKKRALVAGRRIETGLLYIGGTLPTANGWGTDPALIDPDLSVAERASHHDGHGMSYWPAYAEIGREARAAYLDWLADGSFDDPETNIGYVFLHFYGLERRVLVDARNDLEVARELPSILERCLRLRRTYGGNDSFRRYSDKFIGILEARLLTRIDERAPAKLLRGFDQDSPRISLGLGLRARQGRPIDDSWALCWAKNEPEISKRTPARRCEVEFDRLFAEQPARLRI